MATQKIKRVTVIKTRKTKTYYRKRKWGKKR